MEGEYPQIPATLAHDPSSDKSLPCEVRAIYRTGRALFCELDETRWAEELVLRWNAATEIIAAVREWVGTTKAGRENPERLIEVCSELIKVMKDPATPVLRAAIELAKRTRVGKD